MTEKIAYVVEDNALAREAIVAMLGLQEVRGIGFASAEALLAAGSLRRPSCVILDIRLPQMSGLDLQRRLQQDAPGLPVIVVTGAADVNTARIALLGGAVDFLLKPVEAPALLSAVTRALDNDHQHVKHLRDLSELQRRLAALSEREREIFRLVTDGLQNREIARVLGLSIRTIEAHRASLMEKLKTERAAELFRMRARLDAG